jgi:hypothetical protein
MSTIQDVHSIRLTNLALRIKKYRYGDKVVIKLAMSDHLPILLRSTVHYIAFKPSIDVYDNLSLYLCERDGSSELSVIKSLENLIKSHPSVQLEVSGKTFLSSVNEERRAWKLRNQKDDIAWYNDQIEQVDSKCILAMVPPIRCRVLVLLDHIWISQYCYGFAFVVQQIQVLERIPSTTECAFQAVCQADPVKARFDKLVKVGVPIAAIRAKMTMEGFTKDMIDSVLLEKTPSTPQAPPPPPKPPPPPPPPILRTGGTKSPDMSTIFEQIASGGFQLRKMPHAERKQPPKDDRQFTVSLKELQSARNQLRPLKKAYITDYCPLAKQLDDVRL